MGHDLRQFASYSTVDILDDVEIRREEDVKVPLVHLSMG